MILEAARIMSDWLQHPTYGVNAMLALVPKDGTETTPTVATFEDDVSDPRAAVGRPGAVYPALQIDVLGVDVVENQVVADQGDGNCVVRIRYAQGKAKAHEAKRDGSYTIRAVAWSLRKLNQQAHEGSRTRNQLRLLPARQGTITVRPFYEELEDAVVTAVCLAPYDFRDYATLPP